jgi:hypothetical protein
MLVPRPLLLLPLVTALAAGACDFDIPPAHTYVVSRLAIPTTQAEAEAFGLDLDGDGAVDNQLGAALAALPGVDLQPAVTGAVDRGEVILLLNLQTKSFASSGEARAEVKLGDPATAMPQACAGPDDTTCRRHLAGGATFQISPRSPDHAALVGQIEGGTFQGGPGEVSFELSLGGVVTVPIHLIGARARATGLGEDRIERAVIAGGITMERVDRELIPAIRDWIAALVRASCPGTTPPSCGCPLAPSQGGALLLLLDRAPRDCIITSDEIKSVSPLGPDVTIDGTACLSAGVQIEAVSATF